jgi:hypothetical protein
MKQYKIQNRSLKVLILVYLEAGVGGQSVIEKTD